MMEEELKMDEELYIYIYFCKYIYTHTHYSTHVCISLSLSIYIYIYIRNCSLHRGSLKRRFLLLHFDPRLKVPGSAHTVEGGQPNCKCVISQGFQSFPEKVYKLTHEICT